MKFCYIDECGNNQHNKVHSMCGVVIDFTKINKHKKILEKLRDGLFDKYHLVNKKIPTEIKTYQVNEGKNNWSKIASDIRRKFLLNLCEISQSIPCDLVISLIEFSKFNKSEYKNLIFNGHWQWSAAHIILQVQSKYFKEKNNKGNTLIIFDDHYGELQVLNGVFNCEELVHYFYQNDLTRKKKVLKDDEKLNQVVDILALESSSSIFVQLADVYAYILRRHVELSLGSKELYPGDGDFIAKCFDHLKPKIIWKDKYWNNNNDMSKFYNSFAPDNLKKIIK